MSTLWAKQMQLGAASPLGKWELGEVADEPCAWTIILQYMIVAEAIPAGFLGALFSIKGSVDGLADGIVYNRQQSQARIPIVGGIYSAFGSKILLNFASDDLVNNYTLNITAARFSGPNPDHQTIPVDAGVFGVLPAFTTGIAADPAFQTIEILNGAGAVIQTIALQGHNDFSPIDPLGVFMRNTAAVATWFSCKRKNFLG